jgi:GntR family transcriptional regulator/MocR family aminotransferase
MPAPRLRVDLASGAPVLRQIADQLRVLLVEGALAPGMAVDLGVHFNTVAEAYRQLAAEGWLDLRHGSGARVVERTAPSASPQDVQDYRQRLRELISQVRARGVPAARIAAELRALAEGMQ